jgi:hypothetical protein
LRQPKTGCGDGKDRLGNVFHLPVSKQPIAGQNCTHFVFAGNIASYQHIDNPGAGPNSLQIYAQQLRPSMSGNPNSDVQTIRRQSHIVNIEGCSGDVSLSGFMRVLGPWWADAVTSERRLQD